MWLDQPLPLRRAKRPYEIVQIIDDAPAYFEKMQQHPNAGPEGLVDGK